MLIVLLVAFVSHNNGNGEAPISKTKLKQEYAQDTILVHQEQAPHSSASPPPPRRRRRSWRASAGSCAGRSAPTSCPGRCSTCAAGRTPASGARIGYHCSAKADDISYPFLAVYTPSAHHAVFCKKVYAPVASENVPVSKRCRL